MGDIWLSWFYQYLVGGSLAAFIVFWSLRQGALNLQNKQHVWLLRGLSFGFLTFFCGHGLWLLLA